MCGGSSPPSKTTVTWLLSDVKTKSAAGDRLSGAWRRTWWSPNGSSRLALGTGVSVISPATRPSTRISAPFQDSAAPKTVTCIVLSPVQRFLRGCKNTFLGATVSLARTAYSPSGEKKNDRFGPRLRVAWRRPSELESRWMVCFSDASNAMTSSSDIPQESSSRSSVASCHPLEHPKIKTRARLQVHRRGTGSSLARESVKRVRRLVFIAAPTLGERRLAGYSTPVSAMCRRWAEAATGTYHLVGGRMYCCWGRCRSCTG